jgi:hypothetical protein
MATINEIEIVSGVPLVGGADSLAGKFAEEYGLKIIRFFAGWSSLVLGSQIRQRPCSIMYYQPDNIPHK